MRIYIMFSLFILIFYIPGAVSEFLFLEVELNSNATLPCRGICSGLVTWTEFRTRIPVAQCNQTSCSSLREGFMMSHDQFLKGDWSFIIRDVDYRKRNTYSCDCDGTDLCDVFLRIKPLQFHTESKVGGSLFISVPVSEKVKVEFSSDDDDDDDDVTVPVCTVEGHQYECGADYKQRSSLTSSLHLTDLKRSDQGVYTVWDTVNDKLIFTYNLTVSDSRCVPVWVVVLVVVLLGIIIILLVMVIVYLLKERHENRPGDNQSSKILSESSDQSTPLTEQNGGHNANGSLPMF